MADPAVSTGSALTGGAARWGIRAAEISIGLGLIVWVVFAPARDTAAVVACALAPLLAMAWVAAGGDSWILIETRRDTLPGLGMVVFAGAIGSFLLSQRAGHLVDWITGLEMAGAIGLVFGLFSYTLNAGARSRLGSTAISALAFVAWGYGVIGEADVRLDRTAPATEPVSLLGSYVSRGRHTSYNLRLGAWRWGISGATYSVSSALYRAAAAGEAVCVTSGPGALTLRWSRVELCPTSVSPPSAVGWG